MCDNSHRREPLPVSVRQKQVIHGCRLAVSAIPSPRFGVANLHSAEASETSKHHLWRGRFGSRDLLVTTAEDGQDLVVDGGAFGHFQLEPAEEAEQFDFDVVAFQGGLGEVKLNAAETYEYRGVSTDSPISAAVHAAEDAHHAIGLTGGFGSVIDALVVCADQIPGQYDQIVEDLSLTGCLDATLGFSGGQSAFVTRRAKECDHVLAVSAGDCLVAADSGAHIGRFGDAHSLEPKPIRSAETEP